VVGQEPFHQHGQATAGKVFGHGRNRQQEDQKQDQQKPAETEPALVASAVIVPRAVNGNIFDVSLVHTHALFLPAAPDHGYSFSCSV